jgi:MerR family transcriptional regulator, mercuric resistance operon regulatory protein
LAEIGELLKFDASEDRKRAHRLAEKRIALLDAKIAELQSARAALCRLADDCGRATSSPCATIASLERS